MRPKSAIIIVDVQNDFISGEPPLMGTKYGNTFETKYENTFENQLKNESNFEYLISGSLSISNCPAGHNGEDVSFHFISLTLYFVSIFILALYLASQTFIKEEEGNVPFHFWCWSYFRFLINTLSKMS